MHYANEPEAFPRQCLDQVLPFTVVTDCCANGIQAGCQRGIRDDASILNRADQIVFGDDALSLPDQVVEYIEDLRRSRDHVSPTSQLASIGVERVILEEIAQRLAPPLISLETAAFSQHLS